MSTPTLSNFSVPLKVLGNAPFTLTPPTSNSSGAFSYVSSDTSVATVLGNTVTIVGPGFTNITATQAAAGGFTSKTITAGFSVLTQSPLNNNFVPDSNNPALPENSGVSVSGDFYDHKQNVSFDVNINFQSSDSYTMDVTNYDVTIDYLSLDNGSAHKNYNFETESIPDSIGKKVVGNIIKSNIKKLDTNKRGFPFINLEIYSIIHSVTITRTNNDGNNTVTPAIPPTTVRYVFSYTQYFRYYDTPVEISDFSFDENVGLGDDLVITGLYLDHGANVPIDPTVPETVTFKFNRIAVNNNAANIYFVSVKDFNPSGNYTIRLPSSVNPQGFILNNSYSVTAQGTWELGYDTSKTSSQSLDLLERPEITDIEVLKLDVDNDDDIMKITLAELYGSENVPAPSNVWFEFRNPLGTLVARAGGDPDASGTGIVIPTNNIFLLKLSEIDIISGGGLLNGVQYSVKARVKYESLDPPVFRISDPYNNVTFELTKPTISSPIAVNSLYLRNTSEKIATITVAHAAYKLYAPIADDATGGIEFVFYNASGTAEVARTKAYDFVNTLTASATTDYPIKLSDITTGVLQNDITYKVKAQVTLINHNGDEVQRVSDAFSTVTFALTEPTISNIEVNSLYLRNTSEKIATINVTRESYELYAPYDVDGILFVFYDGVTEVARTSAYLFQNTSVTGSQPYPIKLSQITPTNGVYLENGITYTVKAAVKVTDHANNTEYIVSSKSSTVTFDLTEPAISDIVVNSLSTAGSNANIASIYVTREAYELVAPYDVDGILFVFYDGVTEVARTSAYLFQNTSVTGSQQYPIKLSEVNYTSGYLENDVTYTVKAAVKVTNHAGNTDYIVSSKSYNVTFELVRPVITITPYDVQNDGGADGVFYPAAGATDVDSSSQIVATIDLADAEYELYAPDVTDGILFIFYNASEVEVARTSPYDFSNDSSNFYNIQLDHITASTLLTNGTPYKVKAQVTLTDHSGVEELRPSAAFIPVTFTQNIAPVLSVNIANTWELVSDNNPESYPISFDNSPPIGISGNFSKNAQFGSLYYKHLDTTSTKFLLEYKVTSSTPARVTDWTSVKKAKLVLQGDSGHIGESLENAAERACSSAGTLSTVSSGEYTNIPGTGIGTEQGAIVFYIPQQQVGTTKAFDETDEVEVRVAVIDRTSPSLWGGVIKSSYTESDSLYVILKIDEYNFTAGESDEPWNSVDTNDNLLINIPVSWNSYYSHSVEVDYKYSVGDSYGTAVEFLKSSYPSTVSFVVDPTQETTLYYRVRYVINNPNLGVSAKTNGIYTTKDVDNKFFPESSDYTISNASYSTFNSTPSKSSIKFNLSFNVDPANRLDGVNVYFASPNTSTGSNINKIRIGSSTTSVLNKEITLLLSTIGTLQFMNDAGDIDDSGIHIHWDNYTSANISFEAFRDARVTITSNSPYNHVSSASDPTLSGFYVESGGKSTFGSPDVNPIWNVPVLTAPSADGSITLSGGVINMIGSADDHYIQWTMTDVNDDTTRPYTYNLKMTNNTTSEVIHNTLNFTGPKYVLDIDNASVSDVAKYTIELTKVFNGTTTRPEKSPVDEIVFNTIYVDTSNMDITVRPVSNTTVVNLSWDEPDISGNSVTASGLELSSFDNNIYAHYIQYTDSSFNVLTRLGPSGNLIERIVSPATKKTYTLPVQAIGTLYEFFMYVEAQVKYTVNGAVSSTKSTPFEVPTTLTTSLSQYRVSSVPSFGLLPDSDINIVPVLIQDSSNPTLLMNLNANGLEDEGFISVVVILTQDGTDDKPEGEQVVLIFPYTGSTFSFDQAVVGGAAGNTDPRLGGGDSATSVPINIDYTVLSTDPMDNDYTLTIGTTGSDGRYGLSTLEMPSTVNSGFVSGSIVNYMVILTTRRGTDIGVGEFTYEALPSVQNVEIVTIDGQYFVNFDITSA